MAENANDLEKCEYLVRVDWIREVPKTQAYLGEGFICKSEYCLPYDESLHVRETYTAL